MREIVSVVIPTYNRASFLPRPLDSVLNQTFKDFEVIVVDDGSTDNTRDVIKSYRERDERVKYIWRKNGGSAKARNTGMKIAKGIYIAELDSDDRYYPNTLEEMVKALEREPDVALAYSDMEFEEDGKIVREWEKPDFDKDLLLEWMYISQVRLMRKDAIMSIGGYDESMTASADYDMVLRLSEYFDFLHVRKFLYVYNHHDQRKSVLKRGEQRRGAVEAIERAKKRRGLLEYLEPIT